MPLKRLFAYLTLSAIALWTAGCAGPAKPAEITVAAASDLKVPLTKIAADFERATGATINLSFGSSGLISRQIENGAPIDIFMSASKKFIDPLAKKKLVGQSKPYARAFVVLIGKARTHSELLLPTIKKIAIANPKHAPFGAAAVEILKNDKTWPQVKDKLVYADNVSQAYEFVKTGNADAGFVALSLAKPANIEYTIMNPRLYEPLTLWVAPIAKTKRPKTTRAFIEFLSAPESLKTLESNGIQPLSKSGTGKRGAK